MKVRDKRTLNLLLRRKKFKTLELELAYLTQAENALWLKRITKDYYACGCDAGRIFVLIGIVIIGYYFRWQAFNNASFNFDISQAIYAAIILIAIGLAGKAIGLHIAYARLKRNIQFLMQKFDSKINSKIVVKPFLITPATQLP